MRAEQGRGHFASYHPQPQQQSGSFSATFTYDGDGKRVKSTMNGVTTYFVGAHFELTGSTATKYYYAGSQRIALRTGSWDFTNPVTGTLSFMLGDHLGSTSLTTNASGQVISEIRYKAWGETRYAAGVQPTKYQYTGQFSYEPEFGLYFYNARWYDPYLSHFTQPDTIVPDQYNSLDWNRYSYARNNPVRYTDPSGHVAISDSDGGGSLEQTLLFFKKYGKHKDQFNELYATIYFAEESLADALRDGQLSESEAMELETYEKLIQQERDSAFNNLSQDEFGQLKRFSSAPNLLKRATDRAEIIDGFVVSVQPSPSDEDIFGASLAAAGVVVVFGHGARHLVGLNVTQAEVEAAIRNDIALTVNSASQTGPFWGRVTINGQVIEYRAYPIGNNTINVGTYYDPENK